MSHATAFKNKTYGNTVLQKELSVNGTYFGNKLMDTGAKEISIEWVYHILIMHQPLGKWNDTMHC